MNTNLILKGMEEALADRFRKALRPELSKMEGGSITLTRTTDKLNIDFDQIPEDRIKPLTAIIEEELAQWYIDQTHEMISRRFGG